MQQSVSLPGMPAKRLFLRKMPAKQILLRTLYYIVAIALALLFASPLAWALITSVTPISQTVTAPLSLWPSHFTWVNYQTLSQASNGISTYVFNSTIVAIGTVIGTILLSTLGGYGFARFEFPGRNLLFVAVLATLMIPFQSILTPLFLVLRLFHLQNSLLGLMLVYITFQLPFGVFVMRNAFATVPREVEEAGLIDGCTSWTILYRVMLFIVFPGVITVGLFAFFNSWNEFLAALIFMTDSSKFTLPVLLLNATMGQFGTVNMGAVQSGVVITMLPCLVIFLVLQRYYINGLAAGAVRA